MERSRIWMSASPKRFWTRTISVAVVAMCTASAVSAAPLTELDVNATGQTANKQDTALSLQVVAEQQIQDYGIDDLDQTALSLPSLALGFGPITQVIALRGLSAIQETGIEQSVGLTVDGLQRPRSRQFTVPLLDLASIELVRGPQPVLYGNNATAGVINIVTGRTAPGEAYNAEISVGYEFEFGGPTVTAIVGGSPSDSLGLRLAFRYQDRQGYFENDFSSKREGDTEQAMARLSGVWQALDKLTITAIIEHAQYDVFGHLGEIFGDGSALLEPEDGRLNWRRSATGGLINPLGIFEQDEPGTLALSTNLALLLDYALAEADLSVSMQHTKFLFDLTFDRDATALDILDTGIYEDYEANTIELRYVSDRPGRFNYQFGAGYANTDLINDHSNALGSDRLEDGQIISVNRFLELDATLYSLFAHGTWRLNDSLRLNGGLRYENHAKEPLRLLRCMTGNFGSGLSSIPRNALPPECPLARPHGFESNRSDKNFSPALALEFNYRSDSMVYAKAFRGTKSGGFFDTLESVPQEYEYGDEEVTGLEFGLKSSFLAGAAELNLAVFHNKHHDLQVRSIVAGGRLAITNEAQATVQGIEIDGRWAINQDLLLGMTLTVLDAKYDRYPAGPCNTANSNSRLIGCDLSGQNLPFAPRWSASVFADAVRPLGAGINLVAGIIIDFSDRYHTEDSLDPGADQAAWIRVSARIGLADSQGRWRLSLVGKNLGNEKILASSEPVDGYFVGYLQPPRTIQLEASYRWGH